MPLQTRYYPITFRLRDQSGQPIVGAKTVYLSVLALDPDGNLADSRPVDLGLAPPAPVDDAPTAEQVAMKDLRASEEKETQILSLETDLGRDHIDPLTFTLHIHVEDEVKTVSGASTVVSTHVPVESVGVQVLNVTTNTILSEDIDYIVNYVDGTVSFSAGAVPGNTVHLTYRWAALEKWLIVDDEEHVVGDVTPSTITLDHVPLSSFDVSVYNVTDDATLTEGVNYTVNYSTGDVVFASGADDTDTVRVDYRWLDPSSDFWVDYDTGILTRLTFGDETVSIFMEYVWKDGIYGYVLDVSGLPDGRYLVSIEYISGSMIRVGDQQLVVRDGSVLDDFLGNSNGSGARRLLIRTRQDTDDQEVIGDVLVSVFDADGDQVILGVRTASSTGNVRLSLPEGTYQVYAYKSLVTFENPETIVVEASDQEQIFTLLGVLLTATVPDGVSPDCCLVYGNVQSLDCQPVAGATVRARLKKPPRVVGSSVILSKEACTTTDANGNFQISLVRGTTVTFDVSGTNYESTRVVPDSESVFFDDMEKA